MYVCGYTTNTLKDNQVHFIIMHVIVLKVIDKVLNNKHKLEMSAMNSKWISYTQKLNTR